MSADGGWDFRLPRDASELEHLWAEARRHGVHPGARLRVVSPPVPEDEPVVADAPQRRLSFVGLASSGPSDLSADVDRYLAEGFGQQ